MKILNQIKGFSDRVNFIDDNDVFIGYDLSQDCCEHAGWYILPEITPYSYEDSDNYDIPDVSTYEFDTEFFQEIQDGDLDCGGMVIFKLVSFMKPDLYLHLFNSHNGYYGHGFVVKHSGQVLKEDVI